MRILSLRSTALASVLFLSASAFAPAPAAVGQPVLQQTMVAQADPVCTAYFQCVAQCPTNDVNEWEACNQVCSDLYPCILGGE